MIVEIIIFAQILSKASMGPPHFDIKAFLRTYGSRKIIYYFNKHLIRKPLGDEDLI